MAQWLAVVAMCVQGECAFWASVHEPFPNETACAEKAIEAEAHFRGQGVDIAFSTCLPIKWAGGKVTMERTWKQ